MKLKILVKENLFFYLKSLNLNFFKKLFSHFHSASRINRRLSREKRFEIGFARIAIFSIVSSLIACHC